MFCPNCGSNVSDKRVRCDRCGTDLTLYKKVIKSSNLHYNNGLARARVRDLSGAVKALRTSLQLNKMNTDARNLLGLVYYEMGETVAALSEWVISKHFQPQNNDADEYINKVQSNPTKLDTLNQAIKRYNTALNLAKQGSDDLAIIQLKKVVTLNPHFIRAYQLLALLQMKQGDKDKAKKNLIRAAKIDVTNTTTLRYMRELEEPSASSKEYDSNSEAEYSNNNTIMPISSYREDKPNIIAFVNLVIGVAIGLAVMAFLVIPTINRNKIADQNADYVDYGAGLAQQQEKDNTIKTLQMENEQKEQEIEALKAQIESFVIPEDKSEAYIPLLKVLQLYLTELDKSERDRDLLPIADLLADIDEKQFEDETAPGLITKLREVTYPIATKAYYNKGHKLYSDEKYVDALIELEKAMTFDPENVDAIYFTARAYHRLEDKENAALYYNIVITDYPNSNRASDAKRYLRQVQE